MTIPVSIQHILPRLHALMDLATRLKTEERHCWYDNGRRESVAEHVWRMSLMAMAIAPHLQEPLDMEHLLKMIIVHDLAEAKVGDVPFFLCNTKTAKEQKKAREEQAMREIQNTVGGTVGQELCALWQEYEEAKTYCARIAKALDKLEANLQHNSSPINTWIDKDQERVFGIDAYCEIDPLLREWNNLAKNEASEKMRKAGIDVREVIQRATVQK